MRENNRKYTLITLLALIVPLPSCAYRHTKSNGPSSILERDITKEITELTDQYKKLRNERGHFSGGEWNDDLDNYGGLLHTTLIKLGELLGNSSNTRKDIISIMGTPDAMRQENDKELLIYFWRGWHDYLYFVCEGEIVKKTKWYFTYE